MRISYAFTFEAAHQMADVRDEAGRQRIHGHSFGVEIAVRGAADPETGFVVDFAALERAGDQVREALDHRLLNEVEGLGVPSMENIALWIWRRLAADFPGLDEVAVRRPSRGQSCVYRGPET